MHREHEWYLRDDYDDRVDRHSQRRFDRLFGNRIFQAILMLLGPITLPVLMFIWFALMLR